MSSNIERKLAAIMFTDIAGYTSQMSKDQDVALSMLDNKLKVLKPLIQKHKGALVKEMGDGTLSHFPTPMHATKCSTELQKSLNNNDKLNVRIGIHHGEAIFRDDDVFGDVVNIASRLETMAPPGGVLVSKNVHDKLSSKKEYNSVSLGLQSMKGIGRLVEVFGLKDEYLNVPKPSDYIDTKVEAHKDKEVPSIAIIPFENKGKKEDEFYAYGISADLISDCSSAGLIRVASLSDIEKLDYTNLDNTELSKKLFVRYVSQGVLWKRENMFQLSVELYDTKDKKVVWSDRWQEKWDNLANIKGNLSDGLLKALDTKPKVEQKVDTTNPEAYEFYLKAKHKYNKRKNTDDTEITRGLLNKAIELDDNLIIAKCLIADIYGQMGDWDKEFEIHTQNLKQAKKNCDNQAIIWSLSGIGVYYFENGNYDKTINYFQDVFEISKKIGDKQGISSSLMSTGAAYYEKFDYDRALDYTINALEVDKEIDYKLGMIKCLNSISAIHSTKGNYLKGLDCNEWALSISEKIDNKNKIGHTLGAIGRICENIGRYPRALDCSKRSLVIAEELGDKYGEVVMLECIGSIYYKKNDYVKAQEKLEKSEKLLSRNISINIPYLRIWCKTYLYLTYKHLGIGYNEKQITTLIKQSKIIQPELNLRLYELLEDKSYLDTAYNQIQEKTSVMEDDLKTKFLGYPTPKAIIEEYNKVFKK